MREIEGRGPDSQIWLFLDSVRVSQKPAFHSVPYVGPKKDFLKLENLFLPVVDETGETDMIIVVARFVPK
jgi:stress response protein SCP2